MSDSENTPPPAKAPTVKTSAVPLKKETVRITLRPSAPPSEPLPPAAPPAPSAHAPSPPAPAPTVAPRPTAPRPTASVGAPTIPLRSAPPPPAVRPAGGAPPPVPATRPMGGAPPPPATRPMGGAPPPPAAVGSKTIPLQGPPPAAARPGVPAARPTGTVPGGAPATQALPKATVKLQKAAGPSSGPPTATVSSAPIKPAAVMDDEEEEIDEGPLNIISLVAVLAGVAALVLGLMSYQGLMSGSDTFVQASPATDDEKTAWQSESYGDATGLQMPAYYNPFHSSDAQEELNPINKFDEEMTRRAAIPELVRQ